MPILPQIVEEQYGASDDGIRSSNILDNEDDDCAYHIPKL